MRDVGSVSMSRMTVGRLCMCTVCNVYTWMYICVPCIQKGGFMVRHVCRRAVVCVGGGEGGKLYQWLSPE